MKYTQISSHNVPLALTFRCIVHIFTSSIRCVLDFFGRGLTVARGAAGGFGGGDDSGGGGFRQTFEDTIFVSGMPPESTSEEIADFFGSIGRIKVRG